MSLRFSRRNALHALTALPGVAAMGCSGSAEGEGDEIDDAVVSGPELLRQYKKFVVVVMENRSFDHYFGHLSLPVSEGGEGKTGVNGFTSLAAHTNPDLNGNKVAIHQTTNLAIGDIDHEWDACHAQFNGGAMNGFVLAHQRDLERLNDNNETTKANCFGTTEDAGRPARCGAPNDPMAFYTRKHTPVYHQLVDEYALCDNWFASVMGPTWPNRYYLHAATAGSRKSNKPLSGIGGAARHSIFGQVSAGTRTMKTEYPGLDEDRFCVNFFADVPLLPLMFPTVAGLGNGIDLFDFLPNFNYAHLFDQPRAGGLAGLEKLAGGIFGSATPKGLLDFVAKSRKFPTFETLAREGKLPPISYIEPPYQLAPMDDHPPHDILAGQAFISAIYKILQNSPDWKDTLLVITYDEHGSFYDHVKPGVVGQDTDPEFRQLGFRVPSIVIGPGVKKGYVSKTQYDHCSVISTFTNRFGLAPINDRVRTARDLSDCIDRSTRRGSSGTLSMKRLELSEATVMESAEIADGQKEIVEKVFRGSVPYEAKRVFTAGMFETFERLGVATIRK